MGALRWEKMLEFGVRQGWHADVLMMEPDASHLRDDRRLEAVPAGTRLFSVPLREAWPMRTERWLRRQLPALVRAIQRRRARIQPAGESAASQATATPDKGMLATLMPLRRAHLTRMHYAEWTDWAVRGAALGIALAAESPYEAVISCGPPQMAHEAARRIASTLGIPFVMDLRDQWFSPTAEALEFSGSVWRRLTSKFERQCVEAASLVVTNTQNIENILRQRYPSRQDRFLTVMNGADPDVRSSHPVKPPFTILHAGSLYNGRDPRPFFRGVRRAVEMLGVSTGELRVHFLGNTAYADRPLSEIAAEEGIAGFVSAESFLPRAEAIRAQEQSAMLLLLQQNQEECIPGKLFEYVQLSSWILALSAPGTAVDLVLRNTDADVVAPNDTESIAAIIAQRYRTFQSGGRPTPVNASGRFDRDAQAQLFFNALSSLVAQRHAPAAVTA